MDEREENYTRYLVIGLVLTLIIVIGFGIYSIRESTRLALAAEQFTEERVTHGEEIFIAQCASCHGASGEGGIGPALNDRQVLKTTFDDVFFSVIRSGVPGTQMPAWSVDFGGPLTDEDVRDVVVFMRAWEATAPEIQQAEFEPDPTRGLLLFESTCAVCHGENGQGTDTAPRLNDPNRLNTFPDEWYHSVITNGRPARGMPTWGTVLSADQIEDLVALFGAWRRGEDVQADFSVTVLLDQAIFSLENYDPESASLHIERALDIVGEESLLVLELASDQIGAGDFQAAAITLTELREQWPLGNPSTGAAEYALNCAACHGAGGEGAIGPALLVNQFVQEQTNSELVEFIQVGRPGTAMAGFGDRLDETKIAGIVAFLRLWQGQP
jgi:mono/diheme cytochrome c family protein